ncbi:MAG: hypothetical protein LBP53_07235 [Candidatus Peribacteria bacterium]|nr:hypothetical protein [Candidatus Peribacteria bacterium]
MIGPYYVQSMKIWESDKGITAMCSAVAKLDLRSFDLFTGGARRDWPFLATFAIIFDTPCIFIEKDGSSLAGESLNLKGAKSIAHVADLNNEGASLRLWSSYVQKAGGKISDAFFLIDRLEDGVAVAKELGIKTYSIVDLDDEAWKLLLGEGKISQEVYNSLVEYWKNRWEWGKNNLLEHPEGLSKLPGEKKEKILDTYNTKYPGFKQEVLTKI